MVSTDTDNIFCRIITDILAAHGVKTVVCSPGSRNVPMLAAVNAHSELQTEIVIDERAAAFMALGLALVGRKPVALVCTSGTALLNYAPAVAEAYYQGVPLIVISTDRPVQWIDQDDSQTLNQFEALRRFVKASYDIPSVPQPDAEMQWYVNRLANDAMIEACSRRPGPVHINLRLAPPLSSTTDLPLPQQRIIGMLSTLPELSREQIDALAEEAADCRILLIAGFTQPDARLNRAVTKFCTLPNVALMCETVSNLHVNPLNYMIDSVLTTLTPDKLDSLRPDLVITIGGALISRQVKEWILRVRPQRHWAIGFTHTTVDALQSLTCRIEASPASVLSMLTGALKRRRQQLPSGYADQWLHLRRKANESAREYIESVPWSELTALAKVFRTI
ncbi:MAG: 2-succinyl-5-enolpyruvyl-6-hydroxy-3-cyclohexene-1-carboxylic-acid synthase, partial [Muribaculaceae bacterium]|nr:2-succinyl-5-enolpyruvyl-6-hydroxy-3-cyclohexene-1-carboxylic-acid synthase [Muribaculaceae bacterium]